MCTRLQPPSCSILPIASEEAPTTYCKMSPETQTSDRGPGTGDANGGVGWVAEEELVNPPSLPPDRRPSLRPATRTTLQPPTTQRPGLDFKGQKARGAGRMRTTPLRKPRGRHPPPLPPPLHAAFQADCTRPRAASRRSRASEPCARRRRLPASSCGHHLGRGLRPHASRRPASATDQETSLQIWAPGPSSELASV